MVMIYYFCLGDEILTFYYNTDDAWSTTSRVVAKNCFYATTLLVVYCKIIVYNTLYNFENKNCMSLAVSCKISPVTCTNYVSMKLNDWIIWNMLKDFVL